MRRFVLLVLLTLVLAPSVASARVGETIDECIRRYGKPTAIPVPYDFIGPARELFYFNFRKNNIAIQIGFLNGKAADVSFQHALPIEDPPLKTKPGTPPPPPLPPPPPPPALSQVEIDTLLGHNSNGLHWKVVTDGVITFFPDGPSPQTRYGAYRQRDDGVMATVDGPILHLFTPDWMIYINTKMKANNDQSAENQKKNLEGF